MVYVPINLILAGIYLFEVNNENARIMREICLEFTIKTPELRYSYVILVSLLLTLNKFDILFCCFDCCLSQ